MHPARFVVAASLLVACTAEPARSATIPTTAFALEPNATVVRVVDGDTIVADIDDPGGDADRETVRLIGIDTPETVRPDAPVECFGPEASARTKELLPVGTRVRLERDVEARDDYGRVLAYVNRASDGLFVNLRLVEDGHAELLTFPPNTAHLDRFVVAASGAERAGLGLWSACGG